MRCPNCGKRLRDKKASYCPHCGESLSSQNNKYNDNENLEVLIRRNKNDDLKNTGTILILVGIFFLLLIFGLYLIISGAIMRKEAKANSRTQHEILYFDKANNKFVFYNIKDIEYIVDPKDIIKIYKATLNDEVVARIIYKNKSKTLELGFAFKDDIDKANKFLKEIN